MPKLTSCLGLTFAFFCLAACSSSTVASDGGAEGGPAGGDASPTLDAGDAGPGVDLCSAPQASRAAGCAAADVGLSPELCRCGSKFYWNGSACAATAACRCTRSCESLFDTLDACQAAYAPCRD